MYPLKAAAIQNGNGSGEKEEALFSICEQQSFEVVGLECTASMWDSDGAIGRLWEKFIEQYHEVEDSSKPVAMYGICESDTCNGDQFRYMAAVKADDMSKIDHGMVTRTIRRQRYFEARVSKQVSTPDAYTNGTT